jgi:hypothetical protein
MTALAERDVPTLESARRCASEMKTAESATQPPTRAGGTLQAVIPFLGPIALDTRGLGVKSGASGGLPGHAATRKAGPPYFFGCRFVSPGSSARSAIASRSSG